jgi:hypothetical protein
MSKSLDLVLTGKIDYIRLEVTARLDDKSEKRTPKQTAALKEILQLLNEAADEAEEAGL